MSTNPQPSSPPPPQSSTLVAKLSTSLDAISYLVAFFLVDAFTFGAPPKVISTIITHQDHTTQCVTEKWKSHGKSSSEGMPSLGIRSHSNRSLNYSDGNRTGSGPQGDSQGWKRTRPLSPSSVSQHGGISQDGTLHHNQKEIFERQMSKTLVLQPYVKFVVTSLLWTSFFVLYIRILGTPSVVKAAMSPVYTLIGEVMTLLENPLFRTYDAILAILPMGRERQTGFDTVLAYLNASWLRFLAFVRLHKG